MFSQRKTHRAAKREISDLYREYGPLLKSATVHNVEEILARRDRRLKPPLRRLAIIESVRLLDKAHKLGIEVSKADSWWNIEYGNGEGSYRIHLSEEGMTKTARLIREVKFNQAERWIKLIAPLIAALTGLLGVVIGLIAILRR